MIDEYMLVISMESMELIFRKDEHTTARCTEICP